MANVPANVLLELFDVHKYFHDLHVLRGVTTRVRRGEVVVILGPSGSGKSTLLRCVHQLERIDRNTIRLDGAVVGQVQPDGRILPLRESDAVRYRRQIGMVFQQFNLFPHMTALENVMAGPLFVLRTPADDARRNAHELLALVGLAHKANDYPHQLSGGQQQRVAIARALAMRPKLLLFDEPTSALDPEMIDEVLTVMLDLSRQGKTMIVVTHEMGFAPAAAHRIVFMDEGRIVEEAPPRGLLQPPRPRPHSALPGEDFALTRPMGYIHTVLGPIRPSALGPTLMHEHVLCDFYRVTGNPDHILSDEELAIEELPRLQAVGGQALVECTTLDLGRNAPALQRIARRTGLHIVMGTGWYRQPYYPPEIDRLTVGDLADRMVADLTADAPGAVPAGIIGESAPTPTT